MTTTEKNNTTEVQVLADILLSIETHNSIKFEYTKDKGFSNSREVYAHNLYWNLDNSKLLLDGFQILGDSKTDSLKSFKQFDTKYIQNLIILDNKFDIQKGYNPESNRYKNSILGIIE